MHVGRHSPLPAICRLQSRRARVGVRALAHHQGSIQALRVLPAAGRPHAGDGVREGVDAHARVLRSRHVPDGRIGHSYHHRRLAARPRRTDRRHCASDFAHGRHRDDPHFRAGEARALRCAFARAGDQRADQRISPVPDSGRHIHVPRTSRTDRRANRGLDRRREQHGVHVAAGRAYSDFGSTSRRRPAMRSTHRWPRPARICKSSPTRWKLRAAPTW